MPPVAAPRPELPPAADVAIVGGGVVGSALAYYASRAGARCVLLERGRTNAEASGTNAGNIHIQVNQHGTDYTEAYMARLRNKILLHRMAAKVWTGLEEELGADLGRRMPGGLIAADTPEAMRSLEIKTEFERSLGIETEMLDAGGLARLAPGLSPALLGASYLRQEGYANPLLLSPAFLAGARRRGATVLTDSEVTAIARVGNGFRVSGPWGSIQAGQVIAAAGAWTPRLAGLVGARLPITGRVLQMTVTEPVSAKLPFLIQHARRRLTMKQTNYGTVLIGGGWPGGRNADGRNVTYYESIAGSADVARSVWPLVGDLRIMRTWAGMLVQTPGALPVLGALPGVPGFHVAVVTSGFTVGAAAAQLVVDLVAGRRPELDLAPYSPERIVETAEGGDGERP